MKYNSGKLSNILLYYRRSPQFDKHYQGIPLKNTRSKLKQRKKRDKERQRETK